MRPAKLSTNFVPYSDSGFNVKALCILVSMQDNPYFPDPVPPLTAIQQLQAEYNEALINAAGMDTVAVAIKNQVRKNLEQQLARLALYVMYIADGNEAILISSGFSLTKTPTRQVIGHPGNVVLKSGGNSGELVSSVKAVKGATGYAYEITQGEVSAESTWQVYNGTRRSFKFTNLKPGQQYWVRVAALGSGNQKVYSDLAYQWAQ